jgi:hypothetical protein
MPADTRCFCPCHLGSVMGWYPPSVSNPVEALCCCDLCEPLHRHVWKLWKRPRALRKWKDKDDQADGAK